MAINQPSPLLRLPLPLRKRIYEYALTFAGPIEIHPLSRRNSTKPSSLSSKPSPSRLSSLLQVCSQIRKEATPSFYTNNTFLLPWGFPNLGTHWLSTLPSPALQSLQSVHFCYGDGAFWTIYDAQVALKALEVGLRRAGVWDELEKWGGKTWVPVCEVSVHTWRELREMEGAVWVGFEKMRDFNDIFETGDDGKEEQGANLEGW